MPAAVCEVCCPQICRRTEEKPRRQLHVRKKPQRRRDRDRSRQIFGSLSVFSVQEALRRQEAGAGACRDMPGLSWLSGCHVPATFASGAFPDGERRAEAASRAKEAPTSVEPVLVPSSSLVAASMLACYAGAVLSASKLCVAGKRSRRKQHLHCINVAVIERLLAAHATTLKERAKKAAAAGLPPSAAAALAAEAVHPVWTHNHACPRFGSRHSLQPTASKYRRRSRGRQSPPRRTSRWPCLATRVPGKRMEAGQLCMHCLAALQVLVRACLMCVQHLLETRARESPAGAGKSMLVGALLLATGGISERDLAKRRKVGWALGMRSRWSQHLCP